MLMSSQVLLSIFSQRHPRKLFFAEVFQHGDKWKNNLGMFHSQREAKASTTTPSASLAENLQGKKVLFLHQPTYLELF